ncbi:hypothetical protein [Flavobacterium sp. JAS]|uniref:hypothetical protein n=1 Tax=Flavobacterium sp. JAS TaxID=2897329 RepID=UPI001E2C1BE3|nr:hypothetical protein [Flavobacterium sp. JAS]MCD0469153.1 hypothetical protein [Flavobacterium sp. JAS]
MKKLYILFFILYFGTNMIWSQTEYGLLFISDIDAREEQEQTVGIHQIQFDNDMLAFYPNSYFTPIQAQEDFFYVSPNLTTRKIYFNFNSDHRGCFITENPVFDIDLQNNSNNGSEVYFTGCFATTVPYLIHLFQPTNAKNCVEQLIDLHHGWNWQYSYNGINWSDFPSEYQDQRSISFKIKELTGYEDKTKIFFRTGYKTKFTNTVTYDIIPCSPNLVGEPLKVNTLCSYSNDGKVTFTFDRDIANNERFSLNIFDITIPTKPRLVDEINIYSTGFPDRKFTYSGLAKGDYFLRYQTFIGAQETSTADSPPFTISNPSVFSFRALESAPNCHDDFGTINIIPSDGTPPYYYKINTDPEIEFTTAITIQKKSGDYSIKVRDSKNCIDTTANN